MTFKNNQDYVDTLRIFLHLGIEDTDFVLSILNDRFIEEENEKKYLCGMALIYAARYGHRKTLKALLNFPMINEEDFDINTVEKEDGNSALLEAADNGHLKIVQDLIEANADIDITNKKENTSLICAVKMGYLEIVQALIDNEADINLTNNKGNTALMYAVKMGYLNIVQALIHAKAEIDSVNKDGYTPLLEAVKQNNTAITTILISAGADVYAIDKNGKSAIVLALESDSEQSEIIKVLKENGAQLPRYLEDKSEDEGEDEDKSEDEREKNHTTQNALPLPPYPAPVLYSFQYPAPFIPIKRSSGSVFADNPAHKKFSNQKPLFFR
jgi:ankyrin repeat protein